MRAFYRIAPASLPAREDGTPAPPTDFGCVRLHESDTYVYLHSATNPHEALEALGGEWLADSWQGLWDTAPQDARDRIFRAVVERTEVETLETVVRTIPRADKELTDTVIIDRLPMHKFAGDPDPTAVEEG